VQSVVDHSVNQVCGVAVFENQCRTKPPTIVDVFPNPVTRSLGKRPNERKRSLRDNPDVGFAGGSFHCFK